MLSYLPFALSPISTSRRMASAREGSSGCLRRQSSTILRKDAGIPSRLRSPPLGAVRPEPWDGPSASDLRAPDDRTVSWKRDVRVFHKGSFPSSRSFLIHLDISWLEPFTDVLPRTTLDPPFPVTRVIRLALLVLFRSPTPAWASRPASLTLIGLLTRLGRPGPMQVSWGHA